MTPERLEDIRATFLRQQYLADAAGELLGELDRVSKENSLMRAALERIRSIWKDSPNTYEEDCNDMGGVACSALRELP